jgi:hypothetical protein
MTTMPIRDVSLFVEVVGQGYPLLLMHGGPGAARCPQRYQVAGGDIGNRDTEMVNCAHRGDDRSGQGGGAGGRGAAGPGCGLLVPVGSSPAAARAASSASAARGRAPG